MAGPGGREVGRVSVRVLPDTSAFGRSLEKYLTRVERSIRVELPTVLDESHLVSDARRVAAAAEKAAAIDIPADVDGGAATAQANALQRRLSGKKITYDVDIDRGSVAGVINRVARLAGSLRTLAIPAALVGATPAIASLGASAVQAAGAVNLLPAALGAAAIGMGTLKLAFSGFDDALKNLGDPAKFAEAIAGMAPAAQDTARAIRAMQPAFDALRLDVQQQFFAKLGTTVADLGGTYLPILQRGMSATAAAMGDMAAHAGRALMQPQAITSINVLLDETAQAFRNLAPAGGAVVSALTRIAEVGASFLPDLASGATHVAESFNQWAQAAATSGRLNEIIQTSLDVLGQLGRIVGNVGSALFGIFNAANVSGASFLTTVETLTGNLAAFINSAQGAETLRQVFTGLSAAVAGIGSALSTVFAALMVELGPVIEQLGPAVGQLARQLGVALVGAIRVLSPLLLAMATFLRENMVWVGPLAIGLGSLAVAMLAIGRARAAITATVAAFQTFNTVGRSLGLAIAAVTRFTTRVLVMSVQVVARFAVMAAQAVARTVVMAAQVTAQFAIMSARAIASMVAMSARVVARWAFMAAGAMARAVVMAAAWFVAMGPIGWVIAAVVGLVALIIANWDRVKSWTISAWRATVDFVVNAWRSITQSVSSGVSNVVSFVRSLPGKILSALGNLGRLLWGAGADLIRGMINGVKSMIGNLLGTVKNLAQQAVAGVKSWLGIGSPSKVFRELGKWTGQGFAEGIDKAAPDAISAAGDMARGVARTPVASPVAPGVTSGRGELRAAVTAGVFAALDGARIHIDGDGVAKIVNTTNAKNARR